MYRNRPALAFEATNEGVLPRFILGLATPLRRFRNMGEYGPLPPNDKVEEAYMDVTRTLY